MFPMWTFMFWNLPIHNTMLFYTFFNHLESLPASSKCHRVRSLPNLRNAIFYQVVRSWHHCSLKNIIYIYDNILKLYIIFKFADGCTHPAYSAPLSQYSIYLVPEMHHPASLTTVVLYVATTMHSTHSLHTLHDTTLPSLHCTALQPRSSITNDDS
jgi:hypothetical protein